MGEFIAQEGNNGIYGVANVIASPTSDGGYRRSYIGTYQVYSNVADVEDFIASAAERYDIIPVPDSDTMDGKANILQKVSIARNWFSDAWGLDIDALREEVQKRQTTIDMDELRSQIK
ncbi:MAG: putative zinc-binding metallopeptidase [Muribaculum sp.]|nr:putative zinc-binding metallopeptidase [Muribaculum sp.]